LPDERMPDAFDRPRTAQESTLRAADNHSRAPASIPRMLEPPETRGTSAIGRAVWLLQVSTGRWDPSTPVPNFDPTPNESSDDVSLPDDAENTSADSSEASAPEASLPEESSDTPQPADRATTARPRSVAASPILQRAPSQHANTVLPPTT